MIIDLYELCHDDLKKILKNNREYMIQKKDKENEEIKKKELDAMEIEIKDEKIVKEKIVEKKVEEKKGDKILEFKESNSIK
jgi:hypothetical protein